MSRTASRELEPLVNNFEHLSEKRRASEALEKLRKIASLVKPLMRQRNWTVGTLAEFYPGEANLLGLNINRGEKICLRLRYPGDDTQFMPMENVVDTMLHELAHNVHGPHDQHFHALWDKLRDEYEALLRKGYTGEGFLGKGHALGGRRVPMSEVRRQARAAAERRKAQNAVNAGSGQRLGGTGIRKGEDARRIIADAIERRIKIERGCASDTDRGRQVAREEEVKKEKVTTTKVDYEDEEESALMQAYIEMIQEDEQQQLGKDYVRPTQSNPAGARAVGAATPASPSSLLRQQRNIENSFQASRGGNTKPHATEPTPPPGPPPRQRKPSPPPASEPKPEPEPLPQSWTCDICTLINPLNFLTCDACSTERPGVFNVPSSPSPPLRSTTSGSNGNAGSQHPALKPRLNAAENLRKFEAQAAYKKALPIGWNCSCGNFMENEWWTCARCGRMKPSS